MASFRRVDEIAPELVTITIFEDEGGSLGDVKGPMLRGENFSQEITGPLHIDQAFATAAEMARRYGCEIVINLVDDAQWNPAWGTLT